MKRAIKKIHLGLPQDLIKKILWVDTDYRTNPLSHSPGGSDVIVEYHAGMVLGYDRIKFPGSYISTIITNNSNFQPDYSDEFHNSNHLASIKLLLYRIFARKYRDEYEYFNVPFKEIWNSNSSNELPWEELKKFDINYSPPEISIQNDKLFMGKVELSKFLEALGIKGLEFTRGKNGMCCQTQAGVIYRLDTFDINKDSYVTLAGPEVKSPGGESLAGSFWLFNGS